MAAALPRILVLSEIPTPYRLPFFARLANRPEFDLELVFCASEEPDRPWEIDAALADVPHRVLGGIKVPIRTRRDIFVYEINPGIVSLLARSRYDAVVVGGYSVFAEQAAIAIARLRRIPYALHSETTLFKPRSHAVRLAKRALVGPLITNAAVGLAAGTAAAAYLESYGLPTARIRIVPNAIDVESYGRRADSARKRATAIRVELGLPDRFVAFVGRLVEGKGVTDLLEAIRTLGPAAPTLVVAGEGPLTNEVRGTPNVVHLGFLQQERVIELLALADWTIVPSRFETWGVAVNEALACGCPVIVTDAVGSHVDLVVDGVNGRVVPSQAPAMLAAAIAGPRPSGDPSRGRIEQWNYEFAVEQFVDAMRLALHGKLTAA